MADYTADQYRENTTGKPEKNDNGMGTADFISLLIPVLICDASFAPAQNAPGIFIKTVFNAASVLYVRPLSVSGDFDIGAAENEIREIADKIESSGARKTAVKYFFLYVTGADMNESVALTSSLRECDRLLKNRGIISEIILCNTESKSFEVISGSKTGDRKLESAIRKTMKSAFAGTEEMEAVADKSRRKITETRKALYPDIKRHGPNPIIFLIVMNLIIFIAGVITEKVSGINTVTEAGIQDNELISQGEVWRLVTSMFLHADFAHIAGNMMCLYYLGFAVYGFYSNEEIWTVYMGAGLLGNILGYFFLDARSLGASGAIMGLGGLIFYRMIFGKEAPAFRKAGNIGALALSVLFNLLYGLFSEGIDNYGHFGGFAGGMIIAALISLVRKRKAGMKNE